MTKALTAHSFEILEKIFPEEIVEPFSVVEDHEFGVGRIYVPNTICLRNLCMNKPKFLDFIDLTEEHIIIHYH